MKLIILFFWKHVIVLFLIVYISKLIILKERSALPFLYMEVNRWETKKLTFLTAIENKTSLKMTLVFFSYVDRNFLMWKTSLKKKKLWYYFELPYDELWSGTYVYSRLSSDNRPQANSLMVLIGKIDWLLHSFFIGRKSHQLH